MSVSSDERCKTGDESMGCISGCAVSPTSLFVSVSKRVDTNGCDLGLFAGEVSYF